MRYLILGGTGTLGRALTKELLKLADTDSIICFSRDEVKQSEMRAQIGDSRLSFMLGCIRDFPAVNRAMIGVNTAFLVAALKRVEQGQKNTREFIKTDVIGTMNVADAAIANGVPNVIFSSTDKAVSPVNNYGHCKALSEGVLSDDNDFQTRTKFSVYRWANVLGSRGSAIHYFAESLKSKRKVFITDPAMSRFWIRIEDAVSFMLQTYKDSDGLMVPQMKSAPIMDVVEAVAGLLGVSQYDIEVIGSRPGEKIHETILPGMCSSDGPFYTQSELRALISPILGLS